MKSSNSASLSRYFLTHEQWFYRLIGEELARYRRQFVKEQHFRAEPAGELQVALRDEPEGFDAEHPLDLITREIEPEEDLPGERIPDPAVVQPMRRGVSLGVVRSWNTWFGEKRTWHVNKKRRLCEKPASRGREARNKH